MQAKQTLGELWRLSWEAGSVERERSELRNASPKARKSQVWKQKLSKIWSQGILGGSREPILPTCGPSLIPPKGQRRDPDASDDNKKQKK